MTKSSRWDTYGNVQGTNAHTSPQLNRPFQQPPHSFDGACLSVCCDGTDLQGSRVQHRHVVASTIEDGRCLDTGIQVAPLPGKGPKKDPTPPEKTRLDDMLWLSFFSSKKLSSCIFRDPSEKASKCPVIVGLSSALRTPIALKSLAKWHVENR